MTAAQNRLDDTVAECESDHGNDRHRHNDRVLSSLLRHVVEISVNRSINETHNTERQIYRDVFPAV